MTDWRNRHSVIPAVYIVFRLNGKLLLLKRANTGYHDGDYSLPSGHFDGGESAISAAVRESKEEVGVDIDPKDLIHVHTQHRLAEEGDHERLNLFFIAKKWIGKVRNAEPHKCSELLWADKDSLPDNLVPEVKYFLKHFAARQTYGDFGF